MDTAEDEKNTMTKSGGPGDNFDNTQPTTSVFSEGSTNAATSILLQDQSRIPIWNGSLEWHCGDTKDTKLRPKVDHKSLSAIFYATAMKGVLQVIGSNWGDKMVLHLIPKSQLKTLDVKYLEETMSIGVSIDNCPDRTTLTKLLKTGRYVGCAHACLDLDGFNAEHNDLQVTADNMEIIVILYSRGKQSIVGFVAYDLAKFMAKYLEAIPHNESSLEELKEPRSDSEVGLQATSTTSASTNPQEEQLESEPVQMDATLVTEKDQEGESPMETEGSPVFWSYDVTMNFKPLKAVAQSSSSEFVSSDRSKKTNFLKGCKWAPDGSCLMSNSDDDILRIFNVPESLYEVGDWKEYDESSSNTLNMNSVLKIKEGGQVYDYCWYPLMSSFDQVTSCFLTTTADSPVHLWDAFTGKLRASYLAYDQVDQVIAARCIAFDPTGELIHCGFDTAVRTFNIARPGRQCTVRKLKHDQIVEFSQPGIVSCIAINPNLRSVQAVGSYLKTVGLYHDDGSVLCILEGHLGGVTHLKFSHDGTKLFSGGRKDNRLICWDMRYMGEKYKIYDRAVSTNQRIYFDVTPNDKYLVTGGTDGFVKIWDLANESKEPLTFAANSDCVNGVSINPFIPVLATSSGQRHLLEMDDSSDEESDMQPTSSKPKNFAPERDIRLWKFC